ncbi:hypothetical protein QQF64_023247 [Cirrhinus molitorella]|uniref:Integrase p58-like C-terminal domain-containing protein n=1 Tax=Cirrhinus molitorella TaxID=172907 RepID=A0ABR3L790_9TELE
MDTWTCAHMEEVTTFVNQITDEVGSWEEGSAAKSEERGIVQYELEMTNHLEQYREQARENLQVKQKAEKQWKVLLLLSTSSNKLLAKWQGPYTVVQKMGPITYEIHHPDKGKSRQTYHVNLLKE